MQIDEAVEPGSCYGVPFGILLTRGERVCTE